MRDKIQFFWAKWLAITNIIGDIMSLIVMSVFYFTLFLIPSFYYSWIKDEMGKQVEDSSYFQDFPSENPIEQIKEM